MKIGYVRMSTGPPQLQLDALQEAGCEKIFQDRQGGAKTDRAGPAEALNYARKGDCLVVWRLDRLGRSLKHLIEVVEGLEAQGTGFISLQEGFDITSSGGKLIFQIFGTLAAGWGKGVRLIYWCHERTTKSNMQLHTEHKEANGNVKHVRRRVKLTFFLMFLIFTQRVSVTLLTRRNL